ncbi:ras-related protein Rab-13-like isoform X2 [Argiope bruennichi]|nr:ras-related protein Rab-13-like isoform X2 [Argiope bruennichi]
MLRFCKNIFREAHGCTSIDCYIKTITLNDKIIELQLWDTAGQERFKAIIKEYFRKADGVLLAYDMTNLETFMKLSSWLSELKEINEGATIFIVGNKADLLQSNQVNRSTVEKYAQEEKLECWETSAKKNENVDEVFKNLALKALERKKIAFFKELSNGEIKAVSPNSAIAENIQKQDENSLPPIIRLEDDFGDDIHKIKLRAEKPKPKKQSCC